MREDIPDKDLSMIDQKELAQGKTELNKRKWELELEVYSILAKGIFETEIAPESMDLLSIVKDIFPKYLNLVDGIIRGEANASGYTSEDIENKQRVSEEDYRRLIEIAYELEGIMLKLRVIDAFNVEPSRKESRFGPFGKKY